MATPLGLGAVDAACGFMTILALAENVGVGFDDVDLPGFLAGAVDPDLVLEGVAAGGLLPAFASDEFQAPVDGEDLAGEPGGLRVG
jgi:hypothetical protein